MTGPAEQATAWAAAALTAALPDVTVFDTPVPDLAAVSGAYVAVGPASVFDTEGSVLGGSLTADTTVRVVSDSADPGGWRRCDRLGDRVTAALRAAGGYGLQNVPDSVDPDTINPIPARLVTATVTITMEEC